jgi:hypothetical protein
LKPNPVTWFEIPVNDLERAKTFYEHTLGVELSVHEFGPLRMAWFPMHAGAPGCTGSLVLAPSYVPSHQGSMVYFEVGDIPAALKRAEEKGATILREKMSIGEHGFVAHFQDCEGNRVSLHSSQ